MGLLSAGTPLSWSASAPHRASVKQNGIEQFLHIYHNAKDFKDHELKWGDEVEYLLLNFDYSSSKATLLLDAPRLLPILQREEHAQPPGSSVPMLWRPEYATWMIEGTPGIPYRCYASDLVNVERNMLLRRTEVAKLLKQGQSLLTITAFPRTGLGVFTTPPTVPFGNVARSYFTSDQVINPHPRFPTLSRNIRIRRGTNVAIHAPLFKDSNTEPEQPIIPAEQLKSPLFQQAIKGIQERSTEDVEYLQKGLNETLKNTVYMDSAAFGMGSCCLQVTIQGRDMSESRYLYDQLAVMAPLMLALTAATPALRGTLVDTDARWDLISASMDDRTEKEIVSESKPKSRYSSIDCFLSDRDQHNPERYNDLPIPMDEKAYERMVEDGVDHLLAQHIAHLFDRDPMVIYEERLDQDNSKSMDHFENLQTTNWNTVRFKLPPPDTDIGWRTEFRSMEVGLTDFENAAFSVFMVILSRVILAFNLNFYMPMSKVDMNMCTAHKRNAVNSELFYFRKNIFKSSEGSEFVTENGTILKASLVGGKAETIDIDCFLQNEDGVSSGSDCESDPFELMTMDEIFNGKPLCRNGYQEGFEFAGLVPLMRGYLDALNLDNVTRDRLLTYLNFVSQRASGKLCTNATYIRNFIRGHGAYDFDSIVKEEICFDLMKHLDDITSGKAEAPELLGEFHKESLNREKDTPDSMMERMQKKWEGEQGGLLVGSSMPKSVFRDTIEMIATVSDDTRCGC